METVTMLFDHLVFRRDAGLRLADSWVWCGSVVRAEDGWHMFASCWEKRHPMFEGYVLFSRIVHAFCGQPDGAYRLCGTILPAAPLKMAHNPTVIRYGETYLLFFIGTACPDRVPRECRDAGAVSAAYAGIRIYCASAPSPRGPWRMNPEPVLCPEPDSWDRQIVTNPAPCVAPDGRIFLYYRSNTPEGLRIGLAVADSPSGPFRRVAPHPVMRDFDVEDPFVWHDGRSFRMIAKDMRGSLTGELHAGAAFESADGLAWRFREKAYSRALRDERGEPVPLGCLERPQLTFDGRGEPEYLCAAAADGPGGFRNASNTWNTVFRLQPGE
ncbi:MAG: glycosyl hydrolase family 43 [Lentisphaeria bacterium]|nr:glycosyl hydrolase family 43 [Lentisphaeria bacterium]